MKSHLFGKKEKREFETMLLAEHHWRLGSNRGELQMQDWQMQLVNDPATKWMLTDGQHQLS